MEAAVDALEAGSRKAQSSMERLISLVGPQMSSRDKTELGWGLGLEQGLELERGLGRPQERRW